MNYRTSYFFKSFKHYKTTTSFLFITLALSCFLMSTLGLIGYSVHQFINQLMHPLSVSVLLKPDLSSSEIESFRQSIATYPNVRETKTLTPKKLLDRFIQMNPKAENMIEGVSEDFLPTVVEIYFSSHPNNDRFIKNLEIHPYVAQIDDGQEENNALAYAYKIITTILIIIFLIICINTTSNIFNALHVCFLQKKNDFLIIKKLGGSFLFMAFPFLIEGFFVCFFSAFVGYGLHHFLVNSTFLLNIIPKEIISDSIKNLNQNKLLLFLMLYTHTIIFCSSFYHLFKIYKART